MLWYLETKYNEVYQNSLQKREKREFRIVQTLISISEITLTIKKISMKITKSMEIYTNKLLNLEKSNQITYRYSSSYALVRDASPSAIELTAVTSEGRSMGVSLEIVSPSHSGTVGEI